MDEMFLMLLFVAIVLTLLVLIWSLTSIKTKSLDCHVQTTLSAHTIERDVTVAKMNNEGVIQTNKTKLEIAAMHDNTERAKILSELEYKDKNLLLQKEGYQSQLEQERIRQEGKSSRNLLHYQTATNIAQMDLDFRNRKLNSDEIMFSKKLEFKEKHMELEGQLAHKALDFKWDALASQERTSKYLADRSFEGIKLTQEHEDGRHKLTMDTSKSMHSAALSVKRDLGIASINSNERIPIRGFQCREFEAIESTRQREIEAESYANLLTNLAGAAVSILTKGAVSLPVQQRGSGGGGHSAGGLNLKKIEPTKSSRFPLKVKDVPHSAAGT